MIANIGFGALWFALVVAVYSIGSAIYGARRKLTNWVDSARNAMLLTFPLLTISVICLVILLVNGNFEVDYVASVTSKSMPLYLKITALWGGQAGSLLFWTWAMSAFAFAATLRNWERDREFLPWVVVVCSITLSFFLGLIIFVENPLARIWVLGGNLAIKSMFPPTGATLLFQTDGRGLNPLLRHPGMIIHPPMLYLGFVAFVIPYAFAVAALITGRTDDRWIRITRRWTLVAWLFLTLGLLLGARWAYDVLGWGGYWGWDPVEISALMPWLTGTAFLHSVMIQEKRGLFKRWNMLLIILTYDLVLFGTFLTRSGVLSSVHAFAQSSIGPLFFGFIGITFIGSLALLLNRWNDLKSETHMTSWLSREALFLLNNFLFIGILIVCFWGVIFPLISELVTGQKVTVGPPFYEQATAPLFAGLLMLMGIAPLAAWQHSTVKTLGKSIWKPAGISLIIPLIAYLLGVHNWAALFGFWLIALVASVTIYEYGRAVIARARSHSQSWWRAFWELTGRNRRRYGGYIIHLGVVLIGLGVIGMQMFQTETQGTLAQGQELKLDQYTIRYDSIAIFDTTDGRNIARAVVSIYKDGNYVGEIYPRRDYYIESQQPMTIPGLRSTLADDLYVILVDWQAISSSAATFKVYHNPLVNWLWIGGLILIIGTFVAAWPEREIQTSRAKSHKKQLAGSNA